MFNNFERKRVDRINIKKNNKLSKIIILFLIISIAFIIYIFKGYYNFENNILNKNEFVLKIEKGDKIENLSKKLKLDETYLKIYLKKNNPEFKLVAGNFKISENANIKTILEDLEKPIIESAINITLLEGWNIFDIDEYLSKKGLIKKGEYISYVTNKEKITKLTEFFPFIEGLNTLEGFLYPDTYRVIGNNFKINVLVIKQLENFENKVYNKILTKYKNKTIEEIVNLASIVEKEEKNPKEKATVAGILKKRLNSGWMIGADITVCYPYKLTANQCKMVVTKYIKEKNDYNTRTKTGLPKTPIGNPTFNTINSTINSKNTPYWFYLHDIRTGKIYYAETNAGHERNKRLYIK